MPSRILFRKLDQQSFLRFLFPQGGGADPVVFDLRMFENMNVQESKESNLVRYGPIGRPGEMHSYSGAKARRFNVSFTLTLHHLQFEGIALTIDRFFNQSVLDSKEQAKREFLRPPNVGPEEAGGVNVGDPILAKVQNAVRKFFGVESISTNILDQLLGNEDLTPFNNTKALAVYYWWVSLIRSSVMNNTRNPLLGPPIVRLNHGLLYDNIPCVVSNYTIDIDPIAGYENRTLTPRRIVVGMTLEETRSGNFEKFKPNSKEFSDNVAGWEATLEYGTTDPGGFGV